MSNSATNYKQPPTETRQENVETPTEQSIEEDTQSSSHGPPAQKSPSEISSRIRKRGEWPEETETNVDAEADETDPSATESSETEASNESFQDEEHSGGGSFPEKVGPNEWLHADGYIYKKAIFVIRKSQSEALDVMLAGGDHRLGEDRSDVVRTLLDRMEIRGGDAIWDHLSSCSTSRIARRILRLQKPITWNPQTGPLRKPAPEGLFLSQARGLPCYRDCLRFRPVSRARHSKPRTGPPRSDGSEQTLRDWYERSLIDCSTFDAESRRRIQEVVDESEDVFGSEGDVQRFVIAGLRALDGRVEQVSQRIFRVDAPEALGATLDQAFEDKQVTFDRDVAMQFENEVTYLSPDHQLVTALVEHIFDEDEDFGGRRGVKVLPFLDQPGIVFNYRIAFEDGAGEILREELCPVYVHSQTQQAERVLGQRVLGGTALETRPDRSELWSLRDQKDALKEPAETYLSQTVRRIRNDLAEDRQRRTDRELQRLDEYAAAERRRLESFIEDYREQQEAGADMEIAIRGQEKRLQNLEARIQDRKENVREKGRVVSLAPELVNLCYAFPA